MQNMLPQTSSQQIFRAMNIKNDHTLLRNTPQNKSTWGAKVKNNSFIEILDQVYSDDGHPMYKVGTENGDEGYMYALNVQ